MSKPQITQEFESLEDLQCLRGCGKELLETVQIYIYIVPIYGNDDESPPPPQRLSLSMVYCRCEAFVCRDPILRALAACGIYVRILSRLSIKWLVKVLCNSLCPL